MSRAERIFDSHLYRDLVAQPHRHHWEYGHGERFAFFGVFRSVRLLGPYRPSSVLMNYETDPQFRFFVKRQVSDGVVQATKIAQLFLDYGRESSTTTAAVEDFLDRYYAEIDTMKPQKR